MNLNIYKINKDDALKIINEKHAFENLTPDEVFVFGMRLSSQTLDSHGSRMTARTIRNYADDANIGFPLITMHDKKPYPIGRVFYGEVSGTPLTRDKYNGEGLNLDVLAYIPRNLPITDTVNTDDRIRGIETGTFAQGSVGFDCDETKDLICSVCSQPIVDCTHTPGKRYNGTRAFYWVDNGHAQEASLVSVGSNPDAKVFKLVRQKEVIMEREFLMNRMIQINPKFSERLKDIGEETDDALNRVIDILAETNKTIIDLETEKTRLVAKEKIADEFMTIFIDNAIKERVRASGTGKFDEDKYRLSLQRIGDVQYIIEETKNFKELADSILENGKRIQELADKPTEKIKRNTNSNSYKG